jgi:hypothetical protein
MSWRGVSSSLLSKVERACTIVICEKVNKELEVELSGKVLTKKTKVVRERRPFVGGAKTPL